jgi:arsenate reductase
MVVNIEIWHNPRCSKSCETLALLVQAGHQPVIVKYLETPPTAAQIRKALAALGISAIDLVRTGETAFRENGLHATDDQETLIAAMVANPILIERPILFANGKAVIGRPPSSVLDLFP